MKKPNKHYKFINSKTGNVIHYHSMVENADKQKVKDELDAIKKDVAIKNGIYLGTVYWEEIKD